MGVIVVVVLMDLPPMVCVYLLFIPVYTTDSTQLRNDLDVLKDMSNVNENILHTMITTEKNALQRQIDALQATVRHLSSTTRNLSSSALTQEARLTNLEERVQQNYNTLYSGIHEIANKARDIEYAVEKFNLNSVVPNPTPNQMEAEIKTGNYTTEPVLVEPGA